MLNINNLNNNSGSIIDIFDNVVLDYPDNIAIKLEDGNEVSYKNLNNVADNIACILYNLIYNEKRDDNDSNTPLVCVMFDRNVGFFASILGILKANCAYVPVDPSFPPDRQSYIFSHSQCRLLLADQDSYNQAIKLGIDISSCIVIDAGTGNVIEYINIKAPTSRIENIIRIETQGQQSGICSLYIRVNW